jgi:hypothetical protein
MPQNKSHHFVPQFYLRKFGVGNSVSLFNIEQMKPVPRAPISGQCQRDYLYGRDAKAEQKIGKLEDECARVMAQIIHAGVLPQRGSKEHRLLVEFALLQRSRTPAAGKATEESMQRALEFEVSGGPPPTDLDPDNIKINWKNSKLFNIEANVPIAPAMMDLAMKLLINESGVEFITSDSPVVVVNQWCMGDPKDYSTVMAASGIELFLPLSPQFAVLFYDKKIYNVGRPGSEVVLVKNPVDVRSINGLQLLTADTNLYGKIDLEEFKKLPGHWRGMKNDKLLIQRLVSTDGKYQKINQYKLQPDINLKLSFVRIVQAMKQIPTSVKRKMHRYPPVVLERILKPLFFPNGMPERPQESARYVLVEEKQETV